MNRDLWLRDFRQESPQFHHFQPKFLVDGAELAKFTAQRTRRTKTLNNSSSGAASRSVRAASACRTSVPPVIFPASDPSFSV